MQNSIRLSHLIKISIMTLMLFYTTAFSAQKTVSKKDMLKTSSDDINGLLTFKTLVNSLTFQDLVLYAANIKAEKNWQPYIHDLIVRGADFALKDPIFDITPLHLACKNNNYYLVRFLLRRGVDFMAKDCTGKTPLHYACLFNAYSAVLLLCAHGARLSKDNSGHSAYFMAQILKNNVSSYLVKNLPIDGPFATLDDLLNAIEQGDDDSIPDLFQE
jgi:ankyrin repeat protein